MTEKISCLICQSVELRHRFNSKGHEILSCPICNFNQVSKMPSPAKLEQIYAELHINHTLYRDEQAAHKENLSRIEFIKPFLVPGAIILDAGCATGDFLVHTTGTYSAYGIDISKGAIDEARKRLPQLKDHLQSIQLEDIHSLNWPVFDAICLWDVIEHVRDPVSVLTNLFSLLKPGGYLFFSTPDISAPTARIMKANWAFMIPPLHLGFFSKPSVEYLFSNRIPAKICAYNTRGKWTNLAFLSYKLSQICNLNYLSNWLAKSRLGRLNLYVPTNDIAYVAIQKQ